MLYSFEEERYPPALVMWPNPHFLVLLAQRKAVLVLFVPKERSIVDELLQKIALATTCIKIEVEPDDNSQLFTFPFPDSAFAIVSEILGLGNYFHQNGDLLLFHDGGCPQMIGCP